MRKDACSCNYTVKNSSRKESFIDVLAKIAGTSPVVQWSQESQSHSTTSLNSDYITEINTTTFKNITDIFIEEMSSSIVLKLEA